MNDKIEDLLREIDSSLDLIFLVLLFFALGSCYNNNKIINELKNRNNEKQIETSVEQIRDDFTNEHFPAE